MKRSAQKIQATTQAFIEIENIVDNVVILSNNAACLIIEVTAVNFPLMSSEEQQAKLFSYSSFLNSLSFPIQIFIRSKRIDISSYLKLIAEEAKKTQGQLANQFKLYKDFIETLLKVNTVLDKKFYIVIPYSYLEKRAIASPKDVFIKEAKEALRLKAESFYSQLKRLSLSSKTLSKEDLVKLFYEIYNGEFIAPNQVETGMTHVAIKKSL